jgi:surfeit locus 1 family protein
MEGRAGYLVYTPFQLRDRSLTVLNNRGWVPAGPDRRRPPQPATPEAAVKLEGTVTLPPAPGIILGDDRGEALEGGYIRLQHLDPEQWDKDFSATLLPYAVRLDGKNKEGFLRDWQPPGFGKEKHLGYAFQWFAMAAALVIIYIVVNLKRSRTDEH